MAEEARSPPMKGAESPQGGGEASDGADGIGKGGGGGWGGWDFSSFSVLSDLQKAASAAAQEISRNAAAVARSIADINIAEADEESDSSADKEVKELEDDTVDEETLLRKSALDRLEGASEESFLGQGLKVFDSSMGSLASGAWLAFGNALKGGSNLVHKFTSALGSITAVDLIQRTLNRLETVHSEGVHRLSEFCCFSLSHLLVLGKSIISNASKSTSEESEDDSIKIDWPEDSVLKAQIIRFNAQLMSVDLESLSNSFLIGISDIMEAYQAAIKNALSDIPNGPLQQPNLVQEKANTISNLLDVSRSNALEKIQDALKYLAHVVLSTSMPSI